MAKKRAKKPSCVRAQVAGKRVCLRRGARCDRFKRSAYLDAGFDCVKRGRKRVLVRASPTAVRRGRFVALPPSGEPTFRQALAAFDFDCRGPARRPRPRSGSVGSYGLRAAPRCAGSTTTATGSLLRRARCSSVRSRPGPDALTVDIDPEGNVFLNARPAALPRERAACGERTTRRRAAVQQITSIVPAGRGQDEGEGCDRRPPGHGVRRHRRETTARRRWRTPFRGGCGRWARLLSNVLPDPRLRPSSRATWPTCARPWSTSSPTAPSIEFISSLGQLGPDARLRARRDGRVRRLQASRRSGTARRWTPAGGRRWLRQSRPSLFTRTYDGVGFWALLAQDRRQRRTA